MPSTTDRFRVGQTLLGPLFNEPMRVETVAPAGPSSWALGLVGVQSERFRRVAEDRADCYWLYVVTNCNAVPTLEAIPNPARFTWHEVQKVAHYTLSLDEMRQHKGGTTCASESNGWSRLLPLLTTTTHLGARRK